MEENNKTNNNEINDGGEISSSQYKETHSPSKSEILDELYKDIDEKEEYELKKERRTSKVFSIITLIFLVGLALYSGILIGKKQAFSSAIPKAPVGSNSTVSKSNLADWNRLNMIRQQLYQNYNGELKDDAMLEGAIKGMVNSIGDPYTVFYNAKEFKELMDSNNGTFVGVGIQVAPKDGYITVVNPIDGGPAKEAGILANDRIYKINDVTYTDKEMDKAVGVMRGKAGDSVKLTILRDGKELDFNIIRREIVTSAVKSEMLNDKVGMIQLTQFTETSSADFKKALRELKGKGMKGLILDLRGNPGGYLDQSVAIASNFIDKGKLVVSQIEKSGRKIEHKSTDGEFVGLPMVVLIDGGSASASEVITEAFKDYKSGTIVGTKSFGKGIVQSILNVGKGEALKVTTAYFYSPNGKNIHKQGITPDIVVEIPEETRKQPYSRDTDPQYKKAFEVISEMIK